MICPAASGIISNLIANGMVKNNPKTKIFIPDRYIFNFILLRSVFLFLFVNLQGAINAHSCK